MKLIESPFGKMEVHFHRNKTCVLVSPSGGCITINGVQFHFRKIFTLLDGEWQMVELGSRGTYYKNSMIILRFFNWKRGGSPSHAAYTKMEKWVEAFFLPDLNRGTYTAEANAAERAYHTREIADCQSKINEANQLIEKMQAVIAEHQNTLVGLP